MTPTKIIITNILPTGTAFAVVADDMDQNVFVPSRLTASNPVRMGEARSALLVPNHTRPEKTQWLAIDFVAGVSSAPALSVAEKGILEDLEQGRATIGELADSLGLDDAAVQDLVQRLLAAGLLVRVETYDLATALVA